jgi:uncharacterized membrane protein
MDNIPGILSTTGFLVLILGIMFMLFGKKSNERQQSIAIAYVAGGIGLILYSHFMENPDFLELATAKVAAAAVGGIIIFIKLFGRRK